MINYFREFSTIDELEHKISMHLILMPDSFILEFHGILKKAYLLDYINYTGISRLEAIYDKLDWDIISRLASLKETDIEAAHGYLKWEKLNCLNQDHISERFILDNIERIQLTTINFYRKFSESALDKHFDRLFNAKCLYNDLSDEFIEKYADKIGYNSLAITQNLSEAFVDKHIMKFNVDTLCSYHLFSKKLVLKHIDYLNLKLIAVNSNRSLSVRFINYIKRYSEDNTIGNYVSHY